MSLYFLHSDLYHLLDSERSPPQVSYRCIVLLRGYTCCVCSSQLISSVMSEEYTHQLLRMVVGRICQQLGWQAMHSSACDVLVDIMKHYMFTISKTTSAYSFLGEPHGWVGVV